MGNYYEERRIALENSAAVHNARLNELYGRSSVKPEEIPADEREEPETDDRAAKASYADTSTCGDCGATSQYGAFCTGCGSSMSEPQTQGGYCGSCGAQITGARSVHECETRSEEVSEETETEDDEDEDERGGFAKCSHSCPKHCESKNKKPDADAKCNHSCSAHCPEDD